MSKGIIRCTFGSLALAFSAHVVYEIGEYEPMSPNQFADSIITDRDRSKFANIHQALRQREGPFYEKVVAGCKKEEREFVDAKTGLVGFAALIEPAIVYLAEKSQGRKFTFNMNGCIDQKINEAAFFTRHLPDAGRADENFKENTLYKMENTAILSGGLGGALLLWGASGFIRSRRSTSGPATPEVK